MAFYGHTFGIATAGLTAPSVDLERTAKRQGLTGQVVTPPVPV